MRKRIVQKALISVLAGLVIEAGPIAGPAAASQPACLAGDAAATDAAGISAARAAIDASCDCSQYDGSDEHDARDYRRCVSSLIRTVTKDGTLRSKCKGRLAKAYKASTCGQAAGTVACIETDADGEVGCRIRTTEKCVDVPGHFVRVACPDQVRCIDAADDNGDLLVNSADSGACREPATTTTTTAEPETTTTLEAETTTTLPAETTTTLVDTPTTTLDEATTTTLEEATTTTLLDATTTTLEEGTTTTTVEETTTTTMPCGLQQPTPIVKVLQYEGTEVIDTQWPFSPPAPESSLCLPQSILAGGCALNALDGSQKIVFDASESYVPDACPGTTLSYHWQIYAPPGLNSVQYASSGITGYFQPALTILPSSLPGLYGTQAGHDVLWRIALTVTADRGAFPSRTVIFRFDYQQSSLTLVNATNCQIDPSLPQCADEAPNGLPPTEPY